MRRSFAIVAISLGLPVSSSSAATTQPPPPDPSCDGRPVAFHVKRTKAIVRNAYERSDWRDATPASGHQKRAWARHRLCITDVPRRQRLADWIERKRSAWEEHRRKQRRAAWRARWTPYWFGEPTIRYVAIPPAVVRCETTGYYGEGRWGAVNGSSGARYLYQMLPSTYAGVCRSCDWSRRDQHRAARLVWARSGGAEWACA